MSTPVTKCIFCGDTRLTKEHIFSRWTHKYLPPRKKGRALSKVGSTFIDREETSIRKLRGATRDWQVKCICGGPDDTCNNGWMRQKIEDQAKPILTPLIRGTAAVLIPSDQAIIAAWAVLKVMVSEYSEHGKVATHWTQRRWMRMRHQAPALGWSVWIGHYERINWPAEWISLPFFLASKAIVKRRGYREPTYYNASHTTYVVGKLFIQVIHLPMPHDSLTLDRLGQVAFPQTQGITFRIWPDPVNIISWPQRALTDLDADKLAGAMQVYLRDIAIRGATRRARGL